MSLTTKQRRLRQEIEEIASLIGMDHWNIEKFDKEIRTTALQVMKNQLIRGEIVMKYTLIDEYLTVIICHYYFEKPKGGQSYKKLWNTKKFKIFNHQIMDETYLLPKMRMVNAIAHMPKDVCDNIGRINALRNDITHSFFPENRKVHMPKKMVLYRETDIFTKDGIQKFREDFFGVSNYLGLRAYGVSFDY